MTRKLVVLKLKNRQSYCLKDLAAYLSAKKGFTTGTINVVDGNWVAMRYLDKKHVRSPNTHIWPTYNFHSPIDEYDYKITHIYRGKDLLPSEKFQRQILGYLDPNIRIKFVYWGRNRISGYSVHSSSIMKNKNMYSPSALIYENLVYYCISPQAILGFFKETGISNTDTVVNIGLLKKYQKVSADFNYVPATNKYIVKYTTHITLQTGYIYVDEEFYNFKIHTVFKHKGSFYKLNYYKKLIKLIA